MHIVFAPPAPPPYTDVFHASVSCAEVEDKM